MTMTAASLLVLTLLAFVKSAHQATRSFVFPESSEELGATGPYFHKVNESTGERLSQNEETDGKLLCDINNFQVEWPSTGRCTSLLQQGPCPEGHWVLLHSGNFRPVCQPRRCKPREIYYQKRCVPIQMMPTICSARDGFTAYNSIFDGSTICDCASGKMFWALTNKCYQAYRQGPCNTGSVLILDDEEPDNAKPKCVQTPCVDGEVPYNNKCIKFGSKEPCEDGFSMSYNPSTMQLECAEDTIQPNQVISTGNMACPRGSKRDQRGICRQMLLNGYQGSKPNSIKSLKIRFT